MSSNETRSVYVKLQKKKFLEKLYKNMARKLVPVPFLFSANNP